MIFLAKVEDLLIYSKVAYVNFKCTILSLRKPRLQHYTIAVMEILPPDFRYFIFKSLIVRELNNIHAIFIKTIDAHASRGTTAVPGKAPVKKAGYPTRIPISFDQNKSAILSPTDA